MKQILQSYRTGELWLADVPAPVCGGGGVVVQTAASLISAGTEKMVIDLAKKSLLGKARARPDLVRKVIQKIKTEGFSTTIEKVFSKLDTPISLGYSCAGVVVEAGSAANLQPGDRVACAGAGYATHAELNFVPKNLCVKIPDGVSFEDASFTTLGAIAMQGFRQADLRLGERVAVIGLGLLGLLTVQILKSAGCRVLGSDPDESKVKLALELGADMATSSDLVNVSGAFSEGHGVDAVIITAATSSNQPIEDAAEICRPKGKVVVVGMVGMNVPRDPFYKKELDLRLSMSYGPGRYDPNYEESGNDYPFPYVRWTEQRNMQSFLELVAAGKVTPSKYITHRYDINDALGAYEMIEAKSQPYLGIVITYPQTAALEEKKIDLKPIAATGNTGIGFIGAGNFAKGVLIPNLKKLGGFDLVGLCTRTGMSGVETAKKHEFSYATTELPKLLDDPKINTVFVATRHDSHASVAAAALKSGKHVFVEKPLCTSPEQIEIYEDALSQRNDRVLMVGFNRRFSPHAQAAKNAFARRGTPLMIHYRINAGMIPRESWLQDATQGGGRIIGEVCHFVDLCEYFTGSLPRRVSAMSISTSDARLTAEDSVAINISYDDGSVATIQYLAVGSSDLPKERVELHADGMSAIIDDFCSTQFFGCDAKALKTKQDKGFANELSAFLSAVKSGGERPIPWESLVRTTRVTFAIQQSLQKGREVSADLVEEPA
jgi:predicted dehydrogenase